MLTSCLSVGVHPIEYDVVLSLSHTSSQIFSPLAALQMLPEGHCPAQRRHRKGPQRLPTGLRRAQQAVLLDHPVRLRELAADRH